MNLKNTEDCKQFIEFLINRNHDLMEELQDHDVSSWLPKKWSRNGKQKIKTNDKVQFILDRESDFMWLKNGTTTLVNCTERLFLHKDADCLFGIITDINNDVVAWSMQID